MIEQWPRSGQDTNEGMHTSQHSFFRVPENDLQLQMHIASDRESAGIVNSCGFNLKNI